MMMYQNFLKNTKRYEKVLKIRKEYQKIMMKYQILGWDIFFVPLNNLFIYLFIHILKKIIMKYTFPSTKFVEI